MKLFDRIFAEPELQASPPVLVDVGAAGGVHPAWRRIARYAIGVGFEPDEREAAPLAGAQTLFRRWVYCPGVAVPQRTGSGRATLQLTRSPQCSSTLRPRPDGVREWAFADFFDVVGNADCAALRLEDALQAQNLRYIDWLKCDTQGTDLRLFLSLPETWRARMLAVEFEPGFIDAYADEDRAVDVLAAMAREPFWLAEMDVGRTPRARPELIAPLFGSGGSKWIRRAAPTAPAWVNLRYLRDPAQAGQALDRRAFLLSWVFATSTGQHGQALTIATLGAERFGTPLFVEMAKQSSSALRWSVLRGMPGLVLRRILRR